MGWLNNLVNSSIVTYILREGFISIRGWSLWNLGRSWPMTRFIVGYRLLYMMFGGKGILWNASPPFKEHNFKHFFWVTFSISILFNFGNSGGWQTFHGLSGSTNKLTKKLVFSSEFSKCLILKKSFIIPILSKEWHWNI